MEEDPEVAIRSTVFKSMDEHLVRMRDQVKVVLGKQRSEVYFSYFKEWMRGLKTHGEFDMLGLAMMPKDQKSVHSEFFTAVVNACELNLRDEDEKRVRRSWKVLSDERARPVGIGANKRLKRSRTVADYTILKKEEEFVVHSVPSKFINLFDGLGEATPRSGWLPSKGQISGRLMLAAWENEIEGVQIDVNDIIMSSVKFMVANLLEEAMKTKRSHLTTSSGFSHSFGVRKRRNESGISSSQVLTPAMSPISAIDLLDALKLNGMMLTNPWIRDRLTRRLEHSSALC